MQPGLKMQNTRSKVKIYRSNTGISVQLIDGGKTVIGQVYKFSKGVSPVDQANKFGQDFGKKIIKNGDEKITYDRGRFLYHGRLESFANGMRSVGVKF